MSRAADPERLRLSLRLAPDFVPDGLWQGFRVPTLRYVDVHTLRVGPRKSLPSLARHHPGWLVYQQAALDHTVHRSTFGAYRRNSRGAVAACLVTTMTASSASRTPTRASRTWPSASTWRVKSERTCRWCQVLVPELGSLVCRWWPVFGCVVCVPAGPQATITPSAVLLTDATWYGVPCQTPTTSMSLGIRER